MIWSFFLDLKIALKNIFILSSKWEGLPLTILEASSYSLPIVSMDVGGVSDFITDGENGFLVSPDDIQNFSLYMKRLINDIKNNTKTVSFWEEIPEDILIHLNSVRGLKTEIVQEFVYNMTIHMKQKSHERYEYFISSGFDIYTVNV